MVNPVQYNGGVPDPQNQLVNGQGAITPVWFKFLVGIAQGVNGPGYASRRDFAPAGTTSPLVGQVNNAGLLVVSAGTVEFSRDKGMTWYQVYYQGPIPAQVSGTDSGGDTGTFNGTATQTGGGALPLRAGDQFRVTWTGATPQISYFRDL
jgi:hypothetical protein